MFRAFAILILAFLAIATNQVLAQDQSNPGLVLRNVNSQAIYNYDAESGQGRSGPGGGAEANQVDMPAVPSNLTKYHASIVVENVGTRQIFAVTWLQSEQPRRKSATWHRFRIQQVILPGQTAMLRRTVLTESPIGNDKRSLVNFELGVGADLTNGSPYDLRFGGYSLNGDSSWFEAATGENSHSQIKDLGEQAWSAISEVPVVPASVETITGKMTFNYKAGGPAQVSPENVLVKAIIGHIYVVHTKTDKIDRYAMFRVETIDPKGVCTISWKLAPSPESK